MELNLKFVKRWLGLLLTGSIILGNPNLAMAQNQLVPDKTLGAERSQVIPLDSILGLPIDTITGGAQRGQHVTSQ